MRLVLAVVDEAFAQAALSALDVVPNDAL